MSLPTLNGTARLIDTPELRFSAQGTAVVKLRLAFNARRKDDSGQWVDGDVLYIDGTVFGQHAENIASSMEKGMEVVVTGRPRTESWEKDGQKHSKNVLLVDSIGPALRFATARVEKTGGSGHGRQDAHRAAQAGASAPANDPWVTGAQGGGQQGGWGSGGGQNAWDQDPPF
jgi:single-strand DNA-binding protein